MLYDSTKVLLRDMLQALETKGSIGWEDQAEAGRECLYEMHQMARPTGKAPRNDGAHGKAAPAVPLHERVTRAIPHVKSMVRAIRRRDQATAVVSGRAALAEM